MEIEMRQWMINPIILCDKHLLGEHVEHHMFIGTFKKKLKINGYIQNNLVEPMSIIPRHNILAWELIRRKILKTNKYSQIHKTWINESEFYDIIQYLPNEQINYKINKINAINDLLNRCLLCQSRYLISCKFNLDLFDTYFLPNNVWQYKGL